MHRESNFPCDIGYPFTGEKTNEQSLPNFV